MNNRQLAEACINKQLEPYGIDYNFVIEHPEINGVPWYIYYTFNSRKEYLDWMEYCLHLLTSELLMNKDQACKTFAMFDLSYGLKHNYEKVQIT